MDKIVLKILKMIENNYNSNMNEMINHRTNDSKMSALHAICNKNGGSIKCLLLLLQTQQCNVNLTDEYERTPLRVACRFGRTKIVQILLEYNNNNKDKNQNNAVNINQPCKHHFTPLCSAAQNNETPEIVQLLLEYGVLYAGPCFFGFFSRFFVFTAAR